jgi:hypothetical protein
MGIKSKYGDVEKIEIDDEYWAEVKKYLTANEKASADRALMGAPSLDVNPGAGEQGARMNAGMDFMAYTRELVIQSLSAWNIRGEDEQVLPLEPIEVRREVVGDLPDFVVEKIGKRVLELVKGPDEDARKSVEGVGGDSPEAGEGRAA